VKNREVGKWLKNRLEITMGKKNLPCWEHIGDFVLNP